MGTAGRPTFDLHRRSGGGVPCEAGSSLTRPQQLPVDTDLLLPAELLCTSCPFSFVLHPSWLLPHHVAFHRSQPEGFFSFIIHETDGKTPRASTPQTLSSCKLPGRFLPPELSVLSRPGMEAFYFGGDFDTADLAKLGQHPRLVLLCLCCCCLVGSPGSVLHRKPGGERSQLHCTGWGGVGERVQGSHSAPAVPPSSAFSHWKNKRCHWTVTEGKAFNMSHQCTLSPGASQGLALPSL